MQQAARTKIDAGAVSFVVQHELWDGNLQDHSDQGVVILVEANDTTLLRFNCFDIEKSYMYGPEGKNKLCRMDPTVDGNPIMWSVKQIRNNLTTMLKEAGYEDVAGKVNMGEVRGGPGRARVLRSRDLRHRPQHREAQPGPRHLSRQATSASGWNCASRLAATAAWPFTFWPTWPALLAGPTPKRPSFWPLTASGTLPTTTMAPGTRTTGIFWDRTLVPDTLEWTLTRFKNKDLRDMIARAGYPGVAADLDQDLIDSIMPALEAKARELQPGAEVEVMDGPATPNLVPR